MNNVARPVLPVSDFFRELSPLALDGVARSEVWAWYRALCGSRYRPQFGRTTFYERLERVHGLRVVTVKGVRRYRLAEEWRPWA